MKNLDKLRINYVDVPLPCKNYVYVVLAIMATFFGTVILELGVQSP